jgi:hypothetical protein
MANIEQPVDCTELKPTEPVVVEQRVAAEEMSVALTTAWGSPPPRPD